MLLCYPDEREANPPRREDGPSEPDDGPGIHGLHPAEMGAGGTEGDPREAEREGIGDQESRELGAAGHRKRDG